jgi:hypothetical protein
MSWSVSASGTVAAVKAEIRKQFESARQGTVHIPSEYRSVLAAEQIVVDQLEYLADVSPCGVEVKANGSAWKTPPAGHSNFSLTIGPISGFVQG